MISPIPFWPSLEPCAKLTPVQVQTSRPRIQSGGGCVAGGRLVQLGSWIGACSESSSRRQGEADQGREQEREPDLARLVPVDPRAEAGRATASWPGPRPRSTPIRVCELDAGSPRYQVPRFQTIAASKSASTIASPRRRLRPDQQVDRQQVHDAEGDRRPAEVDAEEVAEPRPEDRRPGPQRLGVNDRGDGVGRVVEPVDELEPKAIANATMSST